MKRLVPVILVVCALWTGASAARAFAPELHYQGVLMQDGEVLEDGDWNAEFRIYDAEFEGSLLWSESRIITTGNGVFSVILGRETPLETADFTQDEAWLETEVDGIVFPRQKITAVGYAFVAASAEAIGFLITQEMIAPDAVTAEKIADGSVSAEKIAEGAVGSVQIAGLAIEGGHIAIDALGADQIADIYVLNTGDTVSGDLLVTGDFGVSNASPEAPIHVGPGSSMSVDAQVLVSRSVDDDLYDTNGHSFSDSSTVNRGGNIGYNSFDARIAISGAYDYDHYAGFQVAPTYSSTGTMTHFYGVFSTIGSYSGAISNAYRYYAAEVQGSGGAVMNNYGLYVPQLTRGTAANYAVYTAGGTPSYFGGPVHFAGNVGINTAGPEAPLQVHQSGEYGEDLAPLLVSRTGAYVEARNLVKFKTGSLTGAAVGTEVKSAQALDLLFMTTNSGSENLAERARITSDGLLGVGTTDPAALLQVGEPGDGSQALANAFNILSSRDSKRDVVALDAHDYARVLDQLDRTRVVRYRGAFEERGSDHIGVIAEEAPQDLVTADGKAVSLGDAVGFLLAAVKAQQEQIESQRRTIKQLDERLARIEGVRRSSP